MLLALLKPFSQAIHQLERDVAGFIDAGIALQAYSRNSQAPGTQPPVSKHGVPS